MVTHLFRDKYTANNGDMIERNYMAISADYATGSSGAAILDQFCNVVGTVCSTRTLVHNGLKDKPAQMVVKNIIPVSSLKALIK